LLVALWIYATIEGVGSARELERLCQKHLVYQWLCGGVRASAGAASFRRRPRLERFLAEALDHCDQLQQQREETAKITGKKPTEARASTTDPEARTMKFPDGGFASLNAIDDAAQRGCTVYAPLKDEQKQLAAGKDPYAAKRYDSVAVASWRERMGTAAGKLIYRLRGQTAEWVNAVCRNRGLYQMPVRGGSKCRTVAVLYAIAHDMVRGAALRAQVAATGG
jgi:hypothetical protein